jgi:hypothetical protein
MRIRKVGSEDAFFIDCECCGVEFRFGPHIYDGQNVADWGIPLCHGCKPPFRQNHAIAATPRLLSALKARGIKVALDPKGVLRVS